MPGMDGTGPMGLGPGTGWGRGGCTGYTPQGRPFQPRGRGMGRGRGFGRGFGFGMGYGLHRRLRAWGPAGWGGYGPGYGGPLYREEEMAWLKNQAEILKAEMEVVQKRIDEMAAEKES